MKTINNDSYALLVDFYELTMANGYFLSNKKEEIVYFDLFFRTVPDKGGYAIFAGLSQIIEYIENLRFTEEDINYLRTKNRFDEAFLSYIKEFCFTGDIYSVPEGTVVFPNEPLIIVRAKAIEAQLIETFLLLTVNHQSLIATKASRIMRSAGERIVFEFGTRRAHGPSSAILGARAAYIAGVNGTSCTLTDKLYGVPASGTMAHSWVQIFDSEYEAFHTYATLYPDNPTFLVDTYNVLQSGVPNVIKVVKEVLWPKGLTKCNIRIDSGDLTYLSKEARKMLDEEGLFDCKIVVSNSLDEKLILDLLNQGASIDAFGVGEKLITSKSDPVFGGVYKLVAVEKDGEIVPKIKISENVAKITTPHFKCVYRLYDKITQKAIGDVICVHDETIDEEKEYLLFHPEHPWKKKTVTNFWARKLHEPIFLNGNKVYAEPELDSIRAYCQNELSSFWDEVKRFDNPHVYIVDLSKKLWDIKMSFLKKD
ncbi:MAG: nicotinate phosphoribosyltransferase [Bacilli bacterium]|jgi:nicotinate phosphoribosyltransferase|nr:nicotinate phosphoribosyltransferase [Bacilli bacterium]